MPFTPTIGQKYTLRAELRSNGVELFVDGSSIGTSSGSPTGMLMSTVGFFNSTFYLNVVIERLTVTDNTTPANSIDLYNDVIAGSSVNWPDQTTNNRDATLINTPTDGTQWQLVVGGGGNDSEISSVMPGMVSSSSISHAVPSNSALISSVMPSMVSGVSLSQGAPGRDAQVSSAMPSMESVVDVVHVLPEFSVSVSSQMPSMQSSMSLFQFVSGNAVVIDSSMPSMVSLASLEKVNPQFSAQISSAMPSMGSSANVSHSTPANVISVMSEMPSMQSSVILTIAEPVDINLSISSEMPSMQSSMSLVNGEIQSIANIQVSFAVNGISVEYQQSNIDISYGE
jgi:hypothetical protein